MGTPVARDPAPNTVDYQGPRILCRAAGAAPRPGGAVGMDLRAGRHLDGLRRFQRQSGTHVAGPAHRALALPFGRHRWVACAGPDSIAVTAGERARSQVWEWANERAKIPVDPENGPPWHLAVQPLTGGGSAVSLVFSHTIADGAASALSIVSAVEGHRWDWGTRRAAAVRHGAARGIWPAPPAHCRTIPSSAARAPCGCSANRPRPNRRPTRPTSPPPGGTVGSKEPVTVPMVAASVDVASFDAKVAELGGTRNAFRRRAGRPPRPRPRPGRRRRERDADVPGQ